MNSLLVIPLVFLVLIYWLEIRVPHISGRGKRARHTAANLAIAGMGGLLNVIFLVAILDAITRWADQNAVGLLRQTRVWEEARLLMAVVLFDLWMYAWHIMNHRIPALWRLHRAHHNDIAMDSTTALRFHPIEILVSQAFNIGVILILGMNLRDLLIYNMILQMVIFFHHSNVGLPTGWDTLLKTIFVTPQMHRVHHSIETYETDSNYSSVFSWWDRIFKTFRMRQETKTIEFGLPYFREAKWQGVAGCIKIPFVG